MVNLSDDLTSHTHTDLSLLQVARNSPHEDHLAHFTSLSCPSKVAICWNSPLLLRSQMQHVASKLQLARRFPQGENETERIVRLCSPLRMLLQTYTNGTVGEIPVSTFKLLLLLLFLQNFHYNNSINLSV